MRKPTVTELLGLRGAIGNQTRAMRAAGWLRSDGSLTEVGQRVLERYSLVLLTCRHCESVVGRYVAEVGIMKELHRRCSVCGSGRQRFEVDGRGYEAVGLV